MNIPPIDTHQKREIVAVYILLLCAGAWFTFKALTPPSTYVPPLPPPTPVPAPVQWDPEVHRLQQLARCVDARDQLRAECEEEGTLAACDRWVEATFICARYDIPAALDE